MPLVWKNMMLCSYKYIFQELKFYVTLKHIHVFFSLPDLVSEEQLIEFVENKDYMILLSTLSSFKGDKEIVFHVLCCLHSLAVPCEYPLCMLSDLHVEQCNVSFLDCVCDSFN